ncbi:hypothetical protein M1P56_09780 [Streptomyces sp. HU2014]|uniref:hypothetical protein n=1 Tax=Streptomyces sp. HU2014 TaxID=2939414 RepID=UPI00200C9B56|nr:hypothetical protein [Streptomyces sp. HU2014]UQI44615.1 hypothetical protein M1P56_09780 [Streptomyces sp. HU2014]
MRKNLPSGLEVALLGRCTDSFCPHPATLVATFQTQYAVTEPMPRGYCKEHVESRFVGDEAYEQHRLRYGGHGIGPTIFKRTDYEIREPNETEAAELTWEQAAAERWAAEGRIGEYRRIVELHAAETVDGLLVDAWTAAACVALHDGLNERNRERWLAMPTAQQCHVAINLMMGGGK